MEMPLGQLTQYPTRYAPELLCAVPRPDGRRVMKADRNDQPVFGADYWTAYEISWLNPQGKPQVAIGRIRVPAASECLVESKSLKLYLNSLNHSRYDSMAAVRATIQNDLDALLKTPLSVELLPPECTIETFTMPAECIDDEPLLVSGGGYQPDLLKTHTGGTVSEVLFTRLFRSHCPVTQQPDWANVYIGYTGLTIQRSALLSYLVGFRCHAGFHEACIEQIYEDILMQCQPKKLWVYGRFLRRGGIDINPFRASEAQEPVLGLDYRQ